MISILVGFLGFGVLFVICHFLGKLVEFIYRETSGDTHPMLFETSAATGFLMLLMLACFVGFCWAFGRAIIGTIGMF